MNKKVILEYVRTILIALLVALFLAGIATAFSKAIGENHARMLSKMVDRARDSEIIHKLINIYKEKAVDNPGNYEINVKLGTLYELIFDYENAELQYKLAIEKSPYGVYTPYFGLANIYVRQKKFVRAANLIKQLDNKNYKPLLVAKGNFYMKLGDALWNEKDYEAALKQYQVAFFFYKKVDSKKKAIAIDGIVDCYNKMANIYFEKNDYISAVEQLETALLYRETPILLYKLAILLKDTNPLEANKYIEKTYKVDPGLINYDIYEEILIKLINHYYQNNQDIEKDLYMQKLKSLRTFQKRYVITEDDIKINIQKMLFKSNLLKTKYNIKAKYNISNTSKYDFNTLYLEVYLRYDDKAKKIHSQKLYSKKAPLKSREDSSSYEFQYEFTEKDEMFFAKKLYLDFYAGKKENMRKIQVFTYELKR